MKKTLIAAIVGLTCLQANATVTSSVATDAAVPNTHVEETKLHFAATNNTATVHPAITYSVATSVASGAHDAGRPVQIASVVIPKGVTKIGLSTPVITGVNADHAAVSVILTQTNTAGDINKLGAAGDEGDTVMIGFLAKDNTLWSPGLTSADTVMTMYSS
ncbi:hypothetical protein CWU58_23455 [Salmonella enterica]|uniref:Fimbrial protein n=1 Tax=Salmonella enterica TaxID=28901 RepID=A0A744J3G5_SALER|nr:hypothetical protein [Salmonella enterica]HAF2529863.1 hypothetical protein [Salmonella enterica]